MRHNRSSLLLQFHRLIAPLFAVKPAKQGKRSFWSILLWWEGRRIPYNLLVWGSAFGSLFLLDYFISHSIKLGPGEDTFEPIVVFFAIILSNVCYTFGWIIEALANAISAKGSALLGATLFRIGLVFSLVVVWLPTLLWGFAWAAHRIHP